MSVRSVLIVLNLVVLVAIAIFVAFRVISRRRNPVLTEPMNQSEFFDDATLEGPRLERSLATALFFFVVFAAAIPMYWLFLPQRNANMTRFFDQQAIDRGQILFSDPTMPSFSSTQSLQCARCHGSTAGGGTAPFVLPSADPTCQTGDTRPQCLPVQVAWKAPALNTVLLRFSTEEVRQILVYGRPNTPMPAWGVESGLGVLNSQGIGDLLAYLQSIQLTPAEAQKNANADAAALRASFDPATPGNFVTTAQNNLASVQAALNAATTPDAKARAQAALTAAQTALANTQAAAAQIARASDGQVFFLTNCARCHTKYWSVFNPTDPKIPLPAPQGSGAFGPKINEGDTVNQFPKEADHIAFVTKGSDYQVPYGIRGVGTGRMPSQASMLTDVQIQAIVEYERTL